MPTGLADGLGREEEFALGHATIRPNRLGPPLPFSGIERSGCQESFRQGAGDVLRVMVNFSKQK